MERRNGDTSADGKESRLKIAGREWSNTTPPRRLATPADAAVAKLSP
jgi:hypothetical protein